jgi:lysine-ketoglutarate reductase/saccharopine dehydrogenase-like protein (TIGR00300 family)
MMIVRVCYEVQMVSEKIILSGHIIDSLTLPKVLDEIIMMGGDYVIEEIEIGRTRRNPSRAVINVSAPAKEAFKRIMMRIKRQGALLEEPAEVTLVKALRNGILPDGFYSTTNLKTDVLVGKKWIAVLRPEMDCAIVVDPEKKSAGTVPMADVKKGDLVVVGERGIRVVPQMQQEEKDEFRFMRSRVSPEKPKEIVIQEIASQMKQIKQTGGKILLVGGPAIVHTSAGAYLENLINNDYIDIMFAGNALAVHDIEYALFETSLGIYLDRGQSAEGGHGHHVRAINTIRRAGGIRRAVSQGILKSGVMYTCVKKKVPFVLAGSIRDDGPLPDVITDAIEAQRSMRRHLKGVSFALMIATELHSIAVGNLLPAPVKVVCVDINPAVVTKLIDRGSFQAAGVVTDAELFLRELSRILTEDEKN